MATAVAADPGARIEPDSPSPRRRFRWDQRLDAVAVGLLAAAISATLVWVPSLWFDEAATVVAATRSWEALGRMLGTVDAVHATYYAFMHLWFDVFPYSPVSLRMPSVLATGVAAGLTVSLGRMLVNRRTGVVAGLLFCMLPRVTWMGTEGRSYALTTMLGVGSTLVFLIAWRRTTAGRPSAWWWVGYTALAILSSAMFLYVAFLVVGHGIAAVLAFARSRLDGEDVHRVRVALLRWVVGGALAGLSCIPLALLSSGQAKQVSWILKPSAKTVHSVLVSQWFFDNSVFAMFAGVLVLATLVMMAVHRTRAQANTLFVVVPIVAVPTLALIGISLVRTPLYSPRYLTMGTPDIAILMAVGLASVRWKSVIAAVLVVGAVLSIPTFIEQRASTAKDLAAWNRVAALVQSQRDAEPAGTADAVIFGPVRRHPAATSRIIENSYPAAFVGMDDLTLETPAAETDGLWDQNRSIASALERVGDADVVYLVTSNKQDRRPVVSAGLIAQGFHIDQQWSLSRTNVVRYER